MNPSDLPGTGDQLTGPITLLVVLIVFILIRLSQRK